MTKKGIVEEIFSKAKFANETNLYYVSYRDFEKIREVELQEFIEESENFQKIWRKRFIPTVLPQKVIVPDAFSHSVKELIVWSPERL